MMNRRRGGFTFVELCIAMGVMAMIAVALATFATASAQHWKQSEHNQLLQISAQQGGHLTTSIVESSRALASVISDPPSLFLWLTDSYDGVADAKAQFAEMAVIEYDPQLKTVFLYRADMQLAQTAGGDADDVLTTAEMSKPTYVNLFKTERWLLPRRALIGPGRQVSDALNVTRVESVEFTPITARDLPAVEMNATLSRGAETKALRAVFTVRAPTTRPSYADGSN